MLAAVLVRLHICLEFAQEFDFSLGLLLENGSSHALDLRAKGRFNGVDSCILACGSLRGKTLRGGVSARRVSSYCLMKRSL